MRIVTFTSDFGSTDFYVGAIKGAILRQAGSVQLVDISHGIRQNDLVRGAFVLRNTYREFPEGSIHILSVGNFHSERKGFLALKHDGHFFIGPDNGVFSLLFEDMPKQAYQLEQAEGGTFPMKGLFSKAVKLLVEGESIERLGPVCETMEQRFALQPVISHAEIRGTVQYIDHYDNVILNVHQVLFEDLCQDRPFALYFKRMEPITKLSRNYYDVPVGEPLCLFNSSGLLEIAINMGRAATMLGLHIDDGIQIKFGNELR